MTREARPPPTEDGRVADKVVVSPPRMEARRARALSAPWGTTSKGVGRGATSEYGSGNLEAGGRGVGRQAEGEVTALRRWRRDARGRRPLHDAWR